MIISAYHQGLRDFPRTTMMDQLVNEPMIMTDDGLRITNYGWPMKLANEQFANEPMLISDDG